MAKPSFFSLQRQGYARSRYEYTIRKPNKFLSSSSQSSAAKSSSSSRITHMCVTVPLILLVFMFLTKESNGYSIHTFTTWHSPKQYQVQPRQRQQQMTSFHGRQLLPEYHHHRHNHNHQQQHPCNLIYHLNPNTPQNQHRNHIYNRNNPTMKLRIGIVGLPNVGKSTLFNSLVQKSMAQAANYPFCTIDPNIAPVPLANSTSKSSTLHQLGQLSNSLRTVPATIDWIDVAGLVEGAHRGEGLGNRFLGTIRECRAVCHVVRAFGDPNVVRVEDGRGGDGAGVGRSVEDVKIVNLELLLADLSHVERRLERIRGASSSKDDLEWEVLEKIKIGLEKGIPARALGLTKEEEFAIKSMGLLTLKPVFYAINVDDVDYTFGRDEAMLAAREVMTSIVESSDLGGGGGGGGGGPFKNDLFVLVSAKIEAEISSMTTLEEQMDFVTSLGMELDLGREEEHLQSILSYNVLPSTVQNLLNLSVVYTGPGVPPERSRTTKAHIISDDNPFTAWELAGRLHGEIQKGFIRAEVVSAPVLIEHSSFTAARDAGCVRVEGRDYVLKSDDVVLIKWKG